MAKQHRMFLVTATALVAALVPPGRPAVLFGQGGGWPAIALGLIVAGCVVTAVRRLVHAGRFLTRKTAASAERKTS